jgi:hypothetical protein
MKTGYNHPMTFSRKIGIAAGILLLLIGLWYFPPVHVRLAWRIEMVRAQWRARFHPPDAMLFVPTPVTPLPPPQVIRKTVASALPAPSSLPTALPTPTPWPLPPSATLSGFRYENQFNRWNYCGPANFAMSLTFWGWKGDRDTIGRAIKPGEKDKNVMPYEFRDYVAENVPGFEVIIRLGGDLEVIKRLVANGYPVIAEKGYYERDYTGKIGWMGHYQFITGYDDPAGVLIVQDTYRDGPDFHLPYPTFMEGWRSFNYLFMVTFPVEREAEVMRLLGNYADETWANRHALEVALREAQQLSGIDQFFAWFNVGSSHVALREYVDAAYAYDYAFQLYAQLAADNTSRPYRMMWYQTGPYWAYYYSGRYQDVINLADVTLQTPTDGPVLEESLLWRGRAYLMIGQREAAIEDFRAALRVHPRWAPALQALRELGIQP